MEDIFQFLVYHIYLGIPGLWTQVLDAGLWMLDSSVLVWQNETNMFSPSL